MDRSIATAEPNHVAQPSWSRQYRLRREAAARFGKRVFDLPLVKRVRDVVLSVVRDGDRVLEIGAGPGRLRSHLAGQRKAAVYHSLDIDPEGHHDFESFDDVEGLYHTIVALEVVEHLGIDEIPVWLCQISDHLVPGGHLVLSTPNVFYPPAYLRDATHRTPLCYDELAGLVSASGLTVERVVRVFHEHWLRGLVKRFAFGWLFRTLGIDFARQVALVAQNDTGLTTDSQRHPRSRVFMSANTKIEWTNATWNPIRGCTKISPGCTHCYAETFAERFRGVPGHPYQQGFDLRLVPGKLIDPIKWSKPQMIFVNSMSDLFHEDVPDEYIELVARIMKAADWHTYQVLTKRSERLRDMLQTKLGFAAECRHIWWGVSVENRKHGLPRVDDLRDASPAMTFLSVEPLLEDLGYVDLRGIHWVIVGGESGHGARPMNPEWVIHLRDQCAAANVPFFFKQWGGVRKAKAGRQLEGRTYDGIPSFAGSTAPPAAVRRTLMATFANEWNAEPVVERT